MIYTHAHYAIMDNDFYHRNAFMVLLILFNIIHIIIITNTRIAYVPRCVVGEMHVFLRDNIFFFFLIIHLYTRR